MQRFVDCSRQLWHLYDELKNLPDAIVKNLFWYITNAPSTISKQRLECLTKRKCLRQKLVSLEHQLHEQMSTTVREVLRGKNVLLMRQIAEDMNWPDQILFDEMVEGFRLTGNFPACGVFKPQVNIPSLSVDELDQNTKYLRPTILGRMKLTEADDLLEVTTTEKEKGWLDGPFSPSQISDMFGEAWLPVRRFGVHQKNKTKQLMIFVKHFESDFWFCRET